MLVTKQNVFRKFWYATVSVESLKDRPKPFVLLNEKLVLFLDADGKAGCLEDPLLPPHRQIVERLDEATAIWSAAITAGNMTATASSSPSHSFLRTRPCLTAR